MLPAQEALDGFAVDLGGTKTAAARIARGGVVERVQSPTRGDADPEAQVDAMADLLARLGHRPGALLGVAVAGRIDGSGRWYAVNRGTLSAVFGFPLADVLRDRFGAIACLNDAAAAALAEARFGSGAGAGNFAYLTISTGVGGGMVMDGRLVRSDNGLAGHVGFVSSGYAEAPCGSGREATVESAAGGRAIAAAAAAAGHPAADARAVLVAAAAGADWAERIVARSAGAVAALAADLAAVLGLDRIAVGGGIGLAPGYLDRVRAALVREPALFQVPLAAAALGHDAPLVGALLSARMEDRS